MHLFFDTETTGLPKRFNASWMETDNWPRIVQLAWVLTDDSGKLINAKDYIVKPNGFTIPYDVSKIHGITQQRAMNEGVLLKYILQEFENDIQKSDLIIAHNMKFDENIICSEYIRNDFVSDFFIKPKFCTMLSSKEYCKAVDKLGRIKYPRLSELHNKLFGYEFSGAHNASADVEATAKCFWRLRQLGVV